MYIFTALPRVDPKTGKLICEPFINIFGKWLIKLGKAHSVIEKDTMKILGNN